ncbi:MAG: ExeM/NucH family extracellular endonuclease [Candidatus Limnocylindrales bacterium]
MFHRSRRPAAMSSLLALALVAGLLPVAAVGAFSAPSPAAWINEIHYDNVGTDTGEAIEIAGAAGTDLTGWRVFLVNGAGGMSYNNVTLSGTIPDDGDGFGTVVLTYPSNGIQNGSPDGIALYDGTSLVQFLSYEGSFAGLGAPVVGVTSTDIGVFELEAPIGESLRLIGTGTTYAHFTWAASAPSSFGAINPGQSFGGESNEPVVIACGGDITLGEGDAAATREITASDGDGTVVGIELTSVVPANGGIALGSTRPAVADGETASAVLTVGTATPGTFVVTLTASNDDPSPQIDPCTIDVTVTAADPCVGPIIRIPTIQGVDDTADVSGTVTTEGVVVGDHEGPQPKLRGFYLQDPTGDGDATTSDGIFVFNADRDQVALGANIRVTGNASEFQGQTQISATSIIDCGGTATVAPTDVSFPVASPTFLERFEGMLVRVPETMTVTEHFQLGRFGQVVVSSGGRLDNPTAVVEPGAAAAALQAKNDLRKVIVDDSSQAQNPDPIVFGRAGLPLSASNTLRGGDTVTNLTGVMTYTWAGNAASGNAYRIRPQAALGGSAQFVAVNARPGPTVDLKGNVRIAGLNLLNYFNTFDGLPDPAGNDNCNNGVGGIATDCRGADTAAEFDRQWPKTVTAILGLDADVIGVNEVENDGYGPTSSIAHLVDRLNAATAPGTYAFIDVDVATGQADALGLDAIKVGMIYRPGAVTPIGTTAALNTIAFIGGGDGVLRSRPSLAQAFETVDGARFVVDVNHFKSKGSACNTPDASDGQGNCNLVRTNAATELAAWLAKDPTGTGDDDVFIVGDLNSYALEDPIDVLLAAGYTNLVRSFITAPYSYVFDGQWGYLDHALGSPSAIDQVVGIEEWHINSDEPSVLDYNTDFKTPGLQASLYAPDRFRVSDHDPIVVGLDAASDRPVVDAGGPYTVVEGGSVQLTAVASDPTGDVLTYAWDLDDDGTFETAGQSVTFSAAGIQAPASRTVAVEVTDANGQTDSDRAAIEIDWSFRWRPPVKAPPAVNRWIAGMPFPVTFSLAGNQGSGVLDGPALFQREDCQTGASVGSAAPVTTIGPSLRYESRSDTYYFLWRTTRSLSRSCGSLIVTLDDGTSHAAKVRFVF